MAANSALASPLTIKLAAALPGGYLILSSGLIGTAGSESELAGVMAHEIAHVAARHGMRQVPSGTVAGRTIPLIFMGGWNGICSRLAPRILMPIAFQQASAAIPARRAPGPLKPPCWRETSNGKKEERPC